MCIKQESMTMPIKNTDLILIAHTNWGENDDAISVDLSIPYCPITFGICNYVGFTLEEALKMTIEDNFYIERTLEIFNFMLDKRTIQSMEQNAIPHNTEQIKFTLSFLYKENREYILKFLLKHADSGEYNNCIQALKQTAKLILDNYT